jgi:hypothetical protein
VALKAKTLKKIKQLTRFFVNYMKYRTVGPHILSKKELKDLVRAGYIGTTKAPKTAISLAYNKTHEQFAGVAAPKQIRDGAIDFLERMFERYADKAGQQLETEILGEVESHLMPFVDRGEGRQIYGLLRDKDTHSKYLGAALKGKVENWNNRWKLIVDTETARAANYGSMDAIFTNNKGKTAEEVYVYKIGPHDGATCEYCYKFWFMSDRVTPRVYKMSELIAGGSNVGKKKSEWKPTVDLTHPHGRHVMVELRPGFGFDGQGNLQYIGKDHDEFRKQRS